MTDFDLSIIIPAKDGAPYLSTLFRSLLRQGPIWDRTQLIFVDDGSRDETPQLLEVFSTWFPHFEVLTNPEATGLANARNTGLSVAGGEHIVFLDGDDWLAPGHLTTLLEAARHLGVDFLRCDHTTVEGTKRVRKLAPMSVRNVPLAPRVGILPVHEPTLVDYPFAWAGLFHRRVLEQGILRFPENFMTAEDRSWIWRLHLQAESFAVVDAPGILYRRGLTTSLSRIVDARQLDFIRAFGQIFDLVAGDRQAEALWPKAIRNWLAILDHQITRFASSPASLRAQLRRGSRAISAKIPPEHLRQEFVLQKQARQLNVASYLDDAPSFVLEMMK